MKCVLKFIRRCLSFLVVLAVIFAVAPTSATASAVLDVTHPGVRAVMALQNTVTPEVMQWPDVLGTAVSLDNAGNPALLVLVDQDGSSVADIVRAFPPQLRGIAVRVELTEKFRAMKGPPGGGGGNGGGHNGGGGGGGGGGVSHTAKQSFPILLGTSGGWANDIANGYCCGGTLGSLVHIGGTQYILSNYHVLEGDGEPTGAPVIQPGLIDVQCNAGSAQSVATTSGMKSLPGSNVDAAIAPVISGRVRTDGAILEIGTISSSIVAASLNQAVKKSGRTTGLTRSSISGLNATVSVSYESSCAGSTAFTKTFTGQILIANKHSGFLNSGDSGSLMVEDVSTNPRAVGLLFAGSHTLAVANPIGDVLNFFGATMVGQ